MWPLSFMFYTKTFCAYLPTYVPLVPPILSLFVWSQFNVCCRVQFMKLLVMQFPLASLYCYFLPCRSKNSPLLIRVCCHLSCLPYSLISILVIWPVKLFGLELHTVFLWHTAKMLADTFVFYAYYFGRWWTVWSCSALYINHFGILYAEYQPHVHQVFWWLFMWLKQWGHEAKHSACI